MILRDTDGMVTPGADEIVIRHAGVYLLNADTGFLGGGTGGARAMQLLICPPGTSTNNCNIDRYATVHDNALSPYFDLTDIARLTAGQRLRLAVRQNSGQGLGNTSAISAVWVAP